ncbi:pectin lyase-like protein [Serendipita vermifera]|nr:pectin lyase-like protein [Serendipita vermifera]
MRNLAKILGIAIALVTKVSAEVPVYGQCGGLNYTGDTTCASGSTCVYSNEYYSQCVPSSSSSTSTATSSTKTSSTKTSSTKTTSTKTSSTKTTSTKTTSTKTSSTKTTSTKTSTTKTSSTKTTSTKTSTTPSSSSTSSSSTSNTPSSTPIAGMEGYAAVGGTTGGEGGTTTRVSTLEDFTAAVTGDSPKIVILTTSLTGDTVIKIGSNTSVYGADGSVTLTGIGLRVVKVSNVIIRNLKIVKVLASAGDAIGIQEASKVWVDHVDLSSDRDHDKDYYDGLCDITHGSTYVTVSWSFLHDHWKTMLIGHSDSNGDEDAALTVTVHHNYWKNLNSRGPSFRFGTGHVYNNYYEDMNDGINTRVGAQLLVENNVWTGTCSEALYATDGGYAVAKDNDFGTCTVGNEAPSGTLNSVSYSYSLTATADVKSVVTSGAGANLTF